MKQVVIPLIVATILILAGCGNSFPGEESGRLALESTVHNLGCMSLVSFESTDGQGYEFGNASFYRMEYAARIRINSGCYGAYGSDDHKLWRFPKKFHSADDDANLQAMGYRLVSGGDVVTIMGSIDFERQGKTWIGREHVF